MVIKVKFIDLFAGIGGLRKGFETAAKKYGLDASCVFTSEIKPHACKVLEQNYQGEKIHGDITLIDTKDIPSFDFLLAGFPCQAFSTAGKRMGFLDTRGTLFFEIERIIKAKQPFGFVLENVEGLVTHDRESKNDKIGRTLRTILASLGNLGYYADWRLLNASSFGVPQERKRVYIVGTKKGMPNLNSFRKTKCKLSDILESGLPCEKSKFIDLLLSRYKLHELHGKAIKDKRGGNDNIHSWDIALKGEISDDQKSLMNVMLKERRKKKWAVDYGIDWMDGMPLTYEHIRTFYEHPNLNEILEDLAVKGYLKKEHPKNIVGAKRIKDTSLPQGYNIVAGKMSFEISKILDPNGTAPTLVAMDMRHIYVTDEGGLRRLSLKEGLRLFGFPDDYKFDIDWELGFDLLGNTVVVPVITAISEKVLDVFVKEAEFEKTIAS